MRPVLTPRLDVEMGQTGLHLGPGPVVLLVHRNSAQESAGYGGAGHQPPVQSEIFFYHNYLDISYEDQVVNYHKQQRSFVCLTKLNYLIILDTSGFYTISLPLIS